MLDLLIILIRKSNQLLEFLTNNKGCILFPVIIAHYFAEMHFNLYMYGI